MMKSLFRWLSKETLPAYIDSFHKINLWARRTIENKQAIALLNTSLDSVENVELMIKNDSQEMVLYDMGCKSATIESIERDNSYRKFMLAEIPSWQMVLVCEESSSTCVKRN
jgi:hypothetical protein